MSDKEEDPCATKDNLSFDPATIVGTSIKDRFDSQKTEIDSKNDNSSTIEKNKDGVQSADTRSSNEIFDEIRGETEGLESRINPFVLGTTDEFSYVIKKRKNSLLESDDSNEDEDDPRKKRVKCLQYIGLFVCAVFLSIIVIYYGSDADEDTFRFGRLSKIIRANISINNSIIDQTITEILLKSPIPQMEKQTIVPTPEQSSK